jgi:hypothetical protein
LKTLTKTTNDNELRQSFARVALSRILLPPFFVSPKAKKREEGGIAVGEYNTTDIKMNTSSANQRQNQRRKKPNASSTNTPQRFQNDRAKFSSNIFLSANCKFLCLNTSSALNECLRNADKTLPLEDIVRLELVNKGEPGDKGRIRCPICLEDPPKFPVVNPVWARGVFRVRARTRREKSRV